MRSVGRTLSLVAVMSAAACGTPDGGAMGTTTSTEDASTGAAASTSSGATGSGTSSETTSPPTGAEEETTSSSEDGSGSSSSSTGIACARPVSVHEHEIGDALADDVSRLAGASEIAPGVTLTTRSDPESRAIARDYLVGRFDAMGLVGELHEYDSDGANVFAEVPSTTGSVEWLLFGAHFDSVSAGPGAADNATGTAMVLAAASYVATFECRDVNVIFMLFDEEEIGLVGSEAAAAWMVDDGRALTSVHTVDMVSWDSDDDLLFEIHRPGDDLLTWYQDANDNAGLGMTIVERDARSSDHTSFRNLGCTAVGLMEGWTSGDTTPYYHTEEDTFDKIDLAYLEVATRLVMQMLADRVNSR